MKALVTGGGGFLGLALVRALRQRGIPVRSFSRNEHPALRLLGAEHRGGDLADPAAVSQAMAGCDFVFHVAAKAGVWGRYADYHNANVVGTQNVIAACRQQGITHLVYTSSPSVVFDGADQEGIDESTPYPTHFEAAYPQTKAAAEKLILAANDHRLATVSLRPHLIWGPGDNHLLPRLAARARAGQLRRIGAQPKRVDTVFIDNAVDAHVLAAERLAPGSPIGGKAYFISQGEPVELWDMINRLLRAIGVAPVKKSIPRWLALKLAWGFEAFHWLTMRPGEPRLTRFVVRELTTSHWYDISAARRDLDYSPRITLAEGLRRLGESNQPPSPPAG
jgi:nucleoside-diphosphate-sugar epimerase